MADGDDYRIVTSRFRGFSPSGKAAFFDKPHASGTVSIPLSLIHGADTSKLDLLFVGEEFTFRLMEWKAEEAGLA